MILDNENLFSQRQAITVSDVSTNDIDLGVNRDIGKGEPLELLFVAEETFTAQAATLTISFLTDDDAAFGSPTVLATSGAIPVAQLESGEQVFGIRVPRVTQRYLRCDYAVANGPFTAGTLTAGIIIDREDDQAYTSGYVVD